MKEQINWFEKIIGSGIYTGYLPFASGTFGSLAALAIYLIPGLEIYYVLLVLIVLFFIYGVIVSSKFEKVYGKDPSECTIDEMVGMWISLLFLPKTITIVVITFFLWRILDIIKPFPARQSEKLKSGWGIMIDDVISGIYTAVIMNLFVLLFNLN